MATKFKLAADPTFKSKVSIPVPGGKSEPVEFTFNYFTKDEYIALFSASPAPSDKELIMRIVASWELSDEFNDANVEQLLQTYQKAAGAIVSKFVEELGPAKLGN